MKTKLSLTLLFLSLMVLSAFAQIMPLFIIFYALTITIAVVSGVDEYYTEHMKEFQREVQKDINEIPEQERELEAMLYEKEVRNG